LDRLDFEGAPGRRGGAGAHRARAQLRGERARLCELLVSDAEPLAEIAETLLDLLPAEVEVDPEDTTWARRAEVHGVPDRAPHGEGKGHAQPNERFPGPWVTDQQVRTAGAQLKSFADPRDWCAVMELLDAGTVAGERRED